MVKVVLTVVVGGGGDGVLGDGGGVKGGGEGLGVTGRRGEVGRGWVVRGWVGVLRVIGVGVGVGGVLPVVEVWVVVVVGTGVVGVVVGVGVVGIEVVREVVGLGVVLLVVHRSCGGTHSRSNTNPHKKSNNSSTCRRDSFHTDQFLPTMGSSH